jgi:hypothetical protein
VESILNFIALHWWAIVPWVYMAVTAAFITMPLPGAKLDGQALYRWIYDAVHQFANLRNQRPTAPGENPANFKS